MFLFGPPGWRPADEGGPLPPPEVDRESAITYDPEVPPSLAWYGFARFLTVLAAALVLLHRAAALPLHHAAAAGFWIAISLAGLGGVFEAAKRAAPIETSRLAVLGAATLALWLDGEVTGAFAAAAAFCILSLAWFLPRRGHLTETELAPIM